VNPRGVQGSGTRATGPAQHRSPLDPEVDAILAALPPLDTTSDLSSTFTKIHHIPPELQPRQTPLERERMLERLRGVGAPARKSRCALCQHEFASINLPTPVTRKAIFALLESWGAQPPGSDASNALRRQPPLCYERVNVCRFCTQFFDAVAEELLAPLLTPDFA